MKIEKNRTLYKVKGGEKMVGIFTSPDEIPGAEQYTIEEISVWNIEGSPVRGDDVYGATGTRTLLINNGESFSSELSEYEPAWGTNPQSALAGLFKGRSRVEVSKLVRFELNKILGKKPQGKNLKFTYPFEGLVDKMEEDGILHESDISVDFYEEYLEAEKRAAAREAKYNSEEVETVVDKIMEIEVNRIKARGATVSCGFAYNNRARDLKRKVLGKFTIEELRTLAKLFSEGDPEEVLNRQYDGEERDMMEWIRPRIPKLPTRNPELLRKFLE